jgi:D-glycero-D-manno-heptose 1,7-bisphosphate phosphatase
MTLSPPKVVILDRDGVINQDSDDYIKSVDDWVPIPGSLDAIARLHSAGFLLGIATNQSGVGRGLFTMDTLWDIHRHMLQQIADHGGFVQRIFFCVHTPEDRCDCRKPKPGLLYQAAEYFACGLGNMTYVGDKFSDIQAARAAGAIPVLVRSGKGAKTEQQIDPSQLPLVYDDLAAFADALIGQDA